MKLAPRRAAFVREYLKDHNGKQAAIRAGYAPNSAKVTASQLLTDPNVSSAVAEAERKTEERAQLTSDQIDARIQALAEESDTPKAVRAKCYELMHKYRGAYTEKVQHSGAIGVVALTGEEIARMSDQQLEAAKALIGAVRGEGQ